jgi:hypothetical protein
MAHSCARKGELSVNRGMEWVTQLLERERLSELTPPPIRMDCSFSLRHENWSLRNSHHVPNELYKYVGLNGYARQCCWGEVGLHGGWNGRTVGGGGLLTSGRKGTCALCNKEDRATLLVYVYGSDLKAVCMCIYKDILLRINQCNFARTVEPRFTNAPVHEQFGS